MRALLDEAAGSLSREGNHGCDTDPALSLVPHWAGKDVWRILSRALRVWHEMQQERDRMQGGCQVASPGGTI